MRIGGLASGMDTDQIIRDLMRAERMPMDKLTQQKQTIEWQRDAYRELNTLMTTFRDNIFDTVMRSANMAAKRVTSSNSSLVTATATAAASNGSFTISKVDRLATAATNVSQSKISADESTKIDPTKSISSQKALFAGESDLEWKKGTVHKETITLNENKNTVALKNDANLVEATSVKVNGKLFTVVTGKAVEDLSEEEVLLNTSTGELNFGKTLNSGTKISVTYVTESDEDYFTSSITTYNSEGKSRTENFAFSGDRTLNQIIQEINGSPVGVSMFYDSFSDKVTVQRKETGIFNPENVGDELNEAKEMVFEGTFFTKVLHLNTEAEHDATNAVFTINGLGTERRSNTFSINGVTFTLRDTFDTQQVTLNIATDTDKVFNTIVGFVNEYNEMLEKINGKLTEERYRDFKPLTDEQKESMSEKDIERWEERAMSGLLRGDSILSSGLDRMRASIYSPVTMNQNTDIRQLSDLGITTTRNYMDRGKLEIDESKLRAAIERDPEGVFQLFTADGQSSAEKGIARRMRDDLQGTMRSVAERAGGSFGRLQNHQFTLGRNITNIDSRISNFERRLQQVEDRYWRQFTAMEKAMQQANSQAEQMWSMLFNQG